MGRMNAALAAMAVMLVAGVSPAAAQTAADREALGSQIAQRFDVRPVQGGVVLIPKDDSRGVRSIELTGGAIAIDGEPVTGAELRRRLDADADPILRLSYLDPAAQRALFEGRGPGLPTPPAAPALPPPPAAEAAPEPAPAPEAGPRRRGGPRSSDRVRIGGGVRVGPDEVINGDVVAIGGDADVDGQVRGDAVAIFGDLELGPSANVTGDAVVVGGALRRDPAARVGGEINEIGLGDVNYGGWWRWPFMGPPGPLFGSSFGSAFALISTGTRLAIYCILASVVLLFGRGYVGRVSERAASEPVKAGAVGFLIQLLFFPVLIASIVVMVVTIIGIPLLVLVPFGLLAFALLCFVGFTAVTYDVGRLATQRYGGDGQNPYLVAVVGMAVLLSPVLLSRLIGFGGPMLWPITASLLALGLLVEYVVWTVGLGAVALLKFDRR
jgi:hypothetical protein